MGHPLHPHQVTPGSSSKGPQPTTSSSRSGQKADTGAQPNSSSNGMNGATAVGSKRARPDAAGAAAAADAGGAQGVVPELPQGKKAKRSKGTTAAAGDAAAGPADGGTAAAAAGGAAEAAAVGNGSSSGSIHPVWQLVLRTQQHPDYARLYTFPSWQKGWKRTSRCGGVCGCVPLHDSASWIAVRHAYL